MRKEFLNWFGNAINLLILIFLVLSVFNTSCFNLSQILISAFGLFVSISIQLRNIIKEE